MKTLLRSVAMLLGLGLLPVAVYARKKVIIEDGEPNSVILVSTDRAGDEIIRIMNETRLPHFRGPKTPRFILTDRQGKLALGIGGYVRTTAEYDFGGITRDVDFYSALIPNKGSAGCVCDQFRMNISTSTLFLKLVGRTKRLGDPVVYTAAGLRGDGRTLRLQNAYATFLDFTLGYSYGSFMDLAVLPPTIDFAGPNSSAFYRTTQLSYMCDKLKNWEFGVGVEILSIGGTTNQYLTINTQCMPDFTASAQYNWNANSHLKLAIVIRSVTYSGSVDNRAHLKVGYRL